MTNRPSQLGELIYQQEDAEGLITIYQSHNLRYLTFGNQTEQSCITLDQPYRLEHVYTQAMMLSLIFRNDVRSALLLGLGGGSLAKALRHARPRLKIDAVEYRQLVIDMAARFFDLPDDEYFNVYCEDARYFINSTNASYDLIFADLYLADGMDEIQLSDAFLEHCQQRLTENGILVVNFWSNDFLQSRLGQEALSRAFGNNVLNLHVHGGNNIAFAFNSNYPDLNKKTFFEDAQQLGLKLNIPLQKLARNFWQQNVQALQINRYS